MKARTYEEWETLVPSCLREDPLWDLQVYRLSLFANDLVREDAIKALSCPTTAPYVDQTQRAVASIGANLAEGYGKSGSKDRARFFEYALGSARESRHWYYQMQGVLSQPVLEHRLELMSTLCRMLIATVRHARSAKRLGD